MQRSPAIANDRDRLLQLAIAERAEQEAEQRWRHQHSYGGGGQHRQHRQRSREKRGGGLLGSVPPEVRRAALNLIDYQLTPVLVDQWRCGPDVRCFCCAVPDWQPYACPSIPCGQCSRSHPCAASPRQTRLS